MNLCLFGGNFVRKPELRKVGTDQVSVVNFSIAVNRKFNARSGEQKKEVTYVDCEAWDSGAETIARNCDKGDYIIIYASAKNESWTDNNNQKRSRVKFRVDRFEFVPGTRRHTPTDEQEEDSEASAPSTEEDDGNDIPF
jgi:single stranded DNA-binding protein